MTRYFLPDVEITDEDVQVALKACGWLFQHGPAPGETTPDYRNVARLMRYCQDRGWASAKTYFLEKDGGKGGRPPKELTALVLP